MKIQLERLRGFQGRDRLREKEEDYNNYNIIINYNNANLYIRNEK